MRIGLLHSLIRKEEKLLLEAFHAAGVEPLMIDDRKLIMDFHSAPEIDVLVERSINHSRALHALRLFESAGVPCINSHQVAQICGDKLLTTAALKDHGIAQPACRVAFTEESALDATRQAGCAIPRSLSAAVVSNLSPQICATWCELMQGTPADSNRRSACSAREWLIERSTSTSISGAL